MPVDDAVEGMLPYVVDLVVAYHKNMFGCISHNFHVQHQLSCPIIWKASAPPSQFETVTSWSIINEAIAN